jgi:broad specificity phosphatase PhoE
VSRAIAELAADHPGADLIAVAHMGVILSHIGLSRGLGLETALGHRIDPLSVTRLDRTARDGPSPRSITSPDDAISACRLTAAPAWRPMGP